LHWFQNYEHHIKARFDEAEAIITRFPHPLNQIGSIMLSDINRARTLNKDNYICCLLPYWLAELTNAKPEWCDRIALGNLFGMLYFFIQDDLMDSPAPLRQELLPLANLCHVQFLAAYRALLPAHSSFWSYYNTYITEWAAAVSTEDHTYTTWIDPIKSAHKSSPIKLTGTALCLLSNQSDSIKEVERATELVLTTLQMSDDLADWEQDFEEGAGNSLLSMIGSQLAQHHKECTPEAVKNAIYLHGELIRYTQIAEEHHHELSKLSIHLQISSLLSFHASMTADLKQIAANIEQDRQRLLQGGFYLWLEKNIN
jgi:hypothetical protein